MSIKLSTRESSLRGDNGEAFLSNRKLANRKKLSLRIKFIFFFMDSFNNKLKLFNIFVKTVPKAHSSHRYTHKEKQSQSQKLFADKPEKFSSNSQ